MTFRDMELLFGCERCGAAPGERCQTKSGRVASLSHSVRASKAYQIWLTGFLGGVREAVACIEYRCDLDKADLDPRGTLETCIVDLKGWYGE